MELQRLKQDKKRKTCSDLLLSIGSFLFKKNILFLISQVLKVYVEFRHYKTQFALLWRNL